jgi:hypothetical protein
LQHCTRKFRPENARHRLLVCVVEHSFEHRRVAERWVDGRRGGHSCKCCARVASGVLASLRAEKDLRERNASRNLEIGAIRFVQPPKVVFGRLDQLRRVLQQELQLLRQAPPDDRVV